MFVKEPLFNNINLSSTNKSCTLIYEAVPLTIKSPPIVALLVIVKVLIEAVPLIVIFWFKVLILLA